jgi:hypothetical protein
MRLRDAFGEARTPLPVALLALFGALAACSADSSLYSYEGGGGEFDASVGGDSSATAPDSSAPRDAFAGPDSSAQRDAGGGTDGAVAAPDAGPLTNVDGSAVFDAGVADAAVDPCAPFRIVTLVDGGALDAGVPLFPDDAALPGDAAGASELLRAQRVVDTRANLEWLRVAYLPANGVQTQADAVTFCASLGMLLPTRTEAASIAGASLCRAAWPMAWSTWTSTSSGLGSAWVVRDDGSETTNPVSQRFRWESALCVRAR